MAIEAVSRMTNRRIRISHAYTAKDGWRLDGTTVEVEVGPDVPQHAIADELDDLMAEAFALGEQEALDRNQGRSVAA